MERIVWKDFEMYVDLEATRAWYAQAEDWNCPCGHCRNYLALEGRLPEEIQNLLDRLGISHRKALYVCELYHRGGQLLYEISYLVAGEIVRGQKDTDCLEGVWPVAPDAIPMPIPLYVEDSAFPAPFFHLYLCIWLPWVLPEPLDGPA